MNEKVKQSLTLTDRKYLKLEGVQHVGSFDEKENWKYYSASVKKYPNVLWTHTADMIASQIMGV